MSGTLNVLLLRGCRGITDITGAERYILTLLESMDRTVCQYRLVCITDPRTLDSPWLQELKSRNIDYESIPVSTPVTLKDVRAVSNLVDELDADIVHTIDHRADFAGIVAAKLKKRAAVVSFFGWTNFEKKSFRGRVYPWVDKRVQKHADVIITDSQATVPSIDWGRRGPPVEVIHNGVDTRKFDPALYDSEIKSRFFGGDRVVLIGMIGRIHPVKGQMELLRAARELYEKYPQCRFLIIGDVPLGYEDYKKRLDQFISSAGLDKVAIITNVHTSEIPKVFSAMDILAAPSHKESFSFTMIEAMSMAVPIVATRVGGNPEMVTDGETGFLVQLGDHHALLQALENLVCNADMRRDFGRRSRQWVMENCSTTIMAGKTARIYQQVLEKRKQHWN